MDKKDYSEYIGQNKETWDEKAKVHYKSAFYNVQSFIDDTNMLSFVAEEHLEIGAVAEKSLLHLMCHIGMDTLSFARLGAKVTGVDFSSEAIVAANDLKSKTKLEANFIQSDIYKLQEQLDEKFDIVFTSVGVLCWLPDLEQWAKIVAHYLKPGGLFYIKDGYPLKNIFEYDELKGLFMEYPYFDEKKTYRWEDETSYTGDALEKGKNISYEWNHNLSSIVNSLIKAGLTIESLNEYNYLGYKHFPFMVQNNSKQWVFPGKYKKMFPLLFSIKARKK